MSIYKDGMMGLIVGDALGGAVQFMTRDEVAKDPVIGMREVEPFGLPTGTWSDDSSMALATLDSIKVRGSIDLKDIMDRFVRWFLDGGYTHFGQAFDIGGTCEEAILDYIKNGDVKTCGRSAGHNNGNGSIMRILPICIFCYEKVATGEMSLKDAVENVHQASALTHAHRISKIGCGIYFFLVKAILENKDNESIKECLNKGADEAMGFYKGISRYEDSLSKYHMFIFVDELASRPESEVKTTGYVLDTLEAAVWGLMNSSSYEECLLKLVNFGDDSDSVGAVAGGLAGLYYGYELIPKDWIEKIQGKNVINDVLGEADFIG